MSRPRKYPEELLERGVRLALESGRSITLRVPETQFGLSERASAGSSGAHLMLLLAI
jgi:hypothetical protein